MIFASVYGIVDGYFVSNYAGKIPFAGLNIIMPFIMMLGAVGNMIGLGGSALIGKTLGEGNREKANSLFSFFTYFMGATVCRYALSIFIIPVSIQFVKGQTGFFVYLRLDSFRQNML